MTIGQTAPQQINTYVFTDLVGSTRLTRALPAPVWRRLKDRHDALVRAEAAAAGGQVVKGLGDGFLVVFRSEEPAVRFAIRVQRAMAAEPWHDADPLEIRIGMDTGPALYRPDPPDFEGDAVNVASHICARARPGEVLLSARAYFGARPELERPGSDVRLELVGAVRLKGLPTLEPLYRIGAPGLREGYPPLVRVGNLAAHRAPPPFVGREALVNDVIAALRERPVVTLLGPGGMGKTRLAVEVATRVEADYAAGAWLAPLEMLRHSSAVPAELLAVLGLTPEGVAEPEAALLRALAEWNGLLILDNVEQLVEEPGGAFLRLVTTMARRCASLRLLCTSRVELRLGDTIEAAIELPPLPSPGPRATLQALRELPSAQLCVERLRLRVRHFTLDADSARYVAAICRATEGVPLLIELAAGQLGRRTLPEIARDVERALTAPSRDADRPDRHRDLARLLDWSLDLLGDERAFFLRLGVFRGGFDPEAAVAVADESHGEELLARLAEAHLVTDLSRDDYLVSQPRYRLLSAAAAYCRVQLGDALPHWRQRHADHFAARAAAANELLQGSAPRAALESLSRDRENLAAALETALERGDLGLAARIGEPLWELYHRRGFWSLIREGAGRLCEAAERAAPGTDGEAHASQVEAIALTALAQAAHDEGQATEAQLDFARAVDLWRTLEASAAGVQRRRFSVGLARALHGWGTALRRQEPGAASGAFQESLEKATGLGHEWLQALNLLALGLIASAEGRGDEAEQRHADALTLFRRVDDPWGLAIALNARAQNLERLGQTLQARDLYSESLDLKRELDDRRGIAITLAALGRLAVSMGDPAAAEPLLRESLQVNRELGDAWGCAVTLGALAAQWPPEAALQALATAHAALEALGGGGSAEATHLDRALGSTRERLPAEIAAATERRGRETPIMRACDRVLSDQPADARPDRVK